MRLILKAPSTYSPVKNPERHPRDEVADMVPNNAGIWMYHCHVNDHVNEGMSTRYVVNVLPAILLLPFCPGAREWVFQSDASLTVRA